jgi:DUF4097 and DUF4098 domain-containing protein YvlB
MRIVKSPGNAPAVDYRWLAAGLLVTVAGMATVGFTACQALGVGTTTEQQSQTYRQQVTRIEFDVDSGNITLAPGDAASVDVSRRLHWRSTKPTVKEDFNGTTMRITSTCPDRDDCSVDFSVRLAAGVVVQIHTASGDVSITDITGALDISSESGDIKVDNAVGALRITGESGQISGTGLHSRDVTAQTDSGDITLTFTDAPQTVDAQTQAGDVLLTVPRTSDGYRVQADTDAGRRTVSVDQNSGSPRSITGKTDSGDVTVTYL